MREKITQTSVRHVWNVNEALKALFALGCSFGSIQLQKNAAWNNIVSATRMFIITPAGPVKVTLGLQITEAIWGILQTRPSFHLTRQLQIQSSF